MEGGGGRERGLLLSSAPLFLSFVFFSLLSISRLSLNISRMTKIRGIPLLDSVQFRVRYDRRIKEVKTHFLQAEPPSKIIYSQNSTRRRPVYYSVYCVYCIQISNTYLPEFLNILLYVEANPE